MTTAESLEDALAFLIGLVIKGVLAFGVGDCGREVSGRRGWLPLVEEFEAIAKKKH